LLQGELANHHSCGQRNEEQNLWVASYRLSPYTQVVFGGMKVTAEVANPVLRKQLMQERNNGSGTLGLYPMRSAWSVETSSNGPSLGRTADRNG
jgi:hypothetical protein